MIFHKDKVERYLHIDKTFFELRVVSFKERIRTPCGYPWFKVRRQILGFFDTFENAEKAMQSFDGLHPKDIFCFYIRELPLDIQSDDDEYRMRTYMPDKTLVVDAYSVCMSERDGDLGTDIDRETKGYRFKVGDIVYWLCDDEVKLAIISIAAFPEEKTVAEIEEDSEKKDEEERTVYDIDNYLDGKDNLCFDDDGCGCCGYASYAALFGEDGIHDHPRSIDVFPVTKKIPNPMQVMLRKNLEEILEFDRNYDLEHSALKDDSDDLQG